MTFVTAADLILPCTLTPYVPISPSCFDLTRGIGLQTSYQFAAEGGHVLLADINESAAAQAAEHLNEQFPKGEAEAIKCDVSSEKDVQRMVDRAVEKWGRLDVLVSCLVK